MARTRALRYLFRYAVPRQDGERASGEAIGIRRRVAALQAHLVRQQTLRPVDEKVGVKLDAALRLGVDLHRPSVDSVRIELGINRPVERAGEVNSPAVAAYLDHLRRPGKRPRCTGVRRLRHDAADAQLAGKLGVERIGDVVLMEIAGAP